MRRPGAALLCEVVAALVSMIPGTQWGFTTLISGILQGLGAEFAFLLLGYSVYGLGAAIFAGAMAAPLEAVYEWFVYWTDWGWGYKIAYLFILTAAGALPLPCVPGVADLLEARLDACFEPSSASAIPRTRPGGTV